MTAYKFNFIDAQVGQIADSSIRRVDSYPADEDLDFGRAVYMSSECVDVYGNHPSIVSYARPEFLIFGVTVYDATLVDGYYKVNTNVSVLTFGRIFVRVETDVEAGFSAYVDVSNGINSGKFIGGGVVDPQTNYFVGQYLTRAQAGELTVLDFRFATISNT